jgi:DNA-binding NtrC family response regulator
MANTVTDVTPLILEGRFEEALDHARRYQPKDGVPLPPTVRLVLAELLERTGRLGESRELLASIRQSSQLTEVDEGRGSLLEGLLAKHYGHLQESAQAFRRAGRIAEQCGSVELLCWSQMRLLGVVGDTERNEPLDSLQTELRRNTERAAIPSVSIAHHVFTAEHEAKHGRLAASRHHSDLAESLLGRHPNVWLRGLLDLQQSCLAYLEGDFAIALSAARHALGVSRLSGHVLTRLIALADMGAAYLAIGQSARAASCVNFALASANPEEQVFGLLLETLAEAQLVDRDVSGCATSLDNAQRLAVRLSQSRSVWHETWNLRTRARLLQRRGSWRESLHLVQNNSHRGRRVSRSFTETQVDALEALALARIGPTHQGSEALLGLLQCPTDSSALFQGLALTAAASLVAFNRTRRDSLCHFARALRILGSTGEASSLVELVDHFVSILSEAIAGTTRAVRVGAQGPLWRPSQVVCHLDTSTSVLSTARPADVELAAFVGTLPDLIAEPQTLGEETLRVLATLAWIRSGRLVRQGKLGPPTIVASYFDEGSSANRAESNSPSLSPLRLSLGTRNGDAYELLVTPRDSCESLIYCGALWRLVSSVLNLARCQGESSAYVTAPEAAHAPDEEFGVFHSPAMIAILESAKRIAPLNIMILLTGESGTGKEVVANVIHRASGMANSPFVPFNCATVSRDMIESHLFGHKRGAFTGALESFRGVIRAAEGGTLFLDEIGEMPLETQPKLLRFLDQGEIQPLGEATPLRVAVRVVAATNANLERMVREGRFREDLYYRLNVVHFRIPPLRERRDEIAPLIQRFLGRYAEEYGKSDLRMSDETMAHLLLYSWPGNVRELSHEMRRLAAFLESGSVIQNRDLRPEFFAGRESPPLVTSDDAQSLCLRVDRPLSELTKDVEMAALSYAMSATGGRMDLAARRLGLSRKGLYLKRQRLGL